MYVQFDYFNLLEVPYIALCNPDRSQLYALANIYNTSLSLKFNALSEFSFQIMQKVKDSDGVDVLDPAYPLLKAKRLVFIENVGYYQIANVVEDRDGEFPIKTVECTSWESELINKQINSFSGTSIKLYDPTSNANTFIGRILLGTNWGIGTVDPDLYNAYTRGGTKQGIYRDFDISSNNVYNALMTTAETAYDCVFTFDPFSRLVNISAVKNLSNTTYDTDIFLSFDNLVRNSQLKEVSEEITTCLDVYGGDGLDIRSVNPLGTNKIYNFEHFQARDLSYNSIWMTNGLNEAIDAWRVKVASYVDEYADLLETLSTRNTTLGVYEADLVNKQGELSALIELKKVRIEQGLDYEDINALITTKNNEITVATNKVASQKVYIANTTTAIVAINDILSLDNVANFTPAQQIELIPLIIENVYQNENIIITDIMTPAKVQEQALELYNQAVDVLSRTCQPRYEFTIESANFVALKEYMPFTNQLNLGHHVTIENDEFQYFKASVLEINMSFDRLDDFSLVFSNRFRLDDGRMINSDIVGSVVKTGSSVSFNSGDWDGYTNNKDSILVIGSVLNAANNQLINDTNQEITINTHGLIGKKLLPNGTYSNNQVWLTSSTLAFSSDGFLTSGLAIGSLQLPGGGTGFGVCAPSIIGELIAGSQLIISNANNSFKVDANGATLKNATFTLLDSAYPKQHVLLSPEEGIDITDRAGQHVFRTVDGNVVVRGTIFASAGTFTGRIEAKSGYIGDATNAITIDNLGISDSNGNYLRKNSMKWGALEIKSDGSAVFSGSVSASKLIGQINGGSQIQPSSITASRVNDLNANSINAGAVRNIDIYGSTIKWGNTIDDPSVIMSGGDLTASIRAQDGIVLMAGSSVVGGGVVTMLIMDRNDVQLTGQTLTQFFTEISFQASTLQISTDYLRVGNADRGVTNSFVVQTTGGGSTTLNFINGILCEPY